MSAIESVPDERQRKLLADVRSGVIMIMRALIEYYGLGWYDFIPRSARTVTPAPVYSETTTVG
jgi:hypothetical protein